VLPACSVLFFHSLLSLFSCPRHVRPIPIPPVPALHISLPFFRLRFGVRSQGNQFFKHPFSFSTIRSTLSALHWDLDLPTLSLFSSCYYSILLFLASDLMGLQWLGFPSVRSQLGFCLCSHLGVSAMWVFAVR